MTFCTITPTRGDRPELLEHCKWQLSRMTIKPDKSYFIDHKPRTPEKDLVERVRMGVALAKEDGFDQVYIIEDDDAYCANYFERMNMDGVDFIGDQRTTYYHIKNNGYSMEEHKGRASLFTTGFRISALTRFHWDGVKKVFLDINLWDYARRIKLKRKFVDSGAVGIKHSIGVTGGIGHKERIYRNFDTDWSFLESKIDAESLEFYKSLQKRIV